MAKVLVICQECSEVFTNEETGEHKTETGHNSWEFLYGGALVFKLFKKWAIIKTEDYNQLIAEQEALKQKVRKQSEIIANMKNRMPQGRWQIDRQRKK